MRKMGSPFSNKRGRNSLAGSPLVLQSSQVSEEFPSVASLKDKAQKVGYLKKLSGGGLLTAGTWRERYCVLVKPRLYFFPSERSSGNEKSSGYLNLEYCDSCTETSARVSREAAHVFTVTASAKGFFNAHSGRYYFSADSATEMKEWVEAIRGVIDKIRSEISTSVATRDRNSKLNGRKGQKGGQRNHEDSSEEDFLRGIEESIGSKGGRLDCDVTKRRVRGPQGRRLPRKPSRSHVRSPSSSQRRSVKPVVESPSEPSDDELASDNPKSINPNGGRDERSSVKGSEETNNGSPQSDYEQGGREEKPPRHKPGGSTNNNCRSNQNIGKRSPWSNSPEPWGASRKVTSNNLLDEPFRRNSAMTYCYSSSSEGSLALPEDSSAKLTGVIDENDSSGGGMNGSNSNQIISGFTCSSITPPPPPVIRRIQREISAKSSPRTSTDFDLHEKIMFVPELSCGARRASSSSSLSTLTADNQSSCAFSSLQRVSKGSASHSSSSRSNGSGVYSKQGSKKEATLGRGPSSSINGSPQLSSTCSRSGGGGGKTLRHRSGHCHSNSKGEGDYETNGNYHNENRGSLTRNVRTFRDDLGNVAFELRQLDVDINSLKQDVGSVQENIATVRGSLDMTREKVSRLLNQVNMLERQIGVAVRETNAARQQAGRLLEEAEAAKATHEQLREEAKNLLGFLRQAVRQNNCEKRNYNNMDTNNGGGTTIDPNISSDDFGLLTGKSEEVSRSTEANLNSQEFDEISLLSEA